MLIGPIFTRELAIAPRRAAHYIYRTAYPLVLFVLMVTAWLLMAGTQNVRNVGDIARFGSVLFQILAQLQLALLAFLAAQSAVSGVAQEKDKRTMLLLLMTRLSNHELVLGKLFASLLDVFVMLLAALPIFMLMTLFGGVSLEQVLRVFAVTLATVLAAGSLGSTVALAREKTFQSLAITVLVLVTWLGAWQGIALAFGDREIGGMSVNTLASSASPYLAIMAAVHPYKSAAAGLMAGENLFVLFAASVASLLNLVGIVMLRVWNPGREVHPGQTEETAAGIFSADHDVKQLEERQAAGSVTKEVAEAARAAHVDARIRNVSHKSREVWDNPVLWREMCTWAYGRKVVFIRLGYLLLFVMAAAGVYFQVASGAALERSQDSAIIPVAVGPLAPFFLVSLVIVNALAVTSITNERDGGALDLLLVTDLTPKEFIFGKMLGVAYVTKEMILLPLALCFYLWWAGGLSLENLFYLVVGHAVMTFFVIMLGVHCGLTYANSRSAIGVSLGNVFFLFLGVVTLILLMISFNNSFQTQLGPFLAFIFGGGVGLFVTLGVRNPSAAIGAASIILPFFTFFAVTSFLADHWSQVFMVSCFAYGFTTAAMLIPALSQFDVAMGRTKGGAEE
ncbi:MAG: ABC transporter permease [Planctomycetales bacterium]|nr:ABC transporter permease [Planctomycetales bacterium]